MVQLFLPIAALLAGSFLTVVWLAFPFSAHDARFDSLLIQQKADRLSTPQSPGRDHSPEDGNG